MHQEFARHDDDDDPGRRHAHLHQRNEQSGHEDFVGGQIEEDTQTRDDVIAAGDPAVKGVRHRTERKKHGCDQIGRLCVHKDQDHKG